MKEKLCNVEKIEVRKQEMRVTLETDASAEVNKPRRC
jgi:hypothetical protein